MNPKLSLLHVLYSLLYSLYAHHVSGGCHCKLIAELEERLLSNHVT